MKPSIKRRIEKRFHELLIKECRGEATPQEITKLNRYDKLRGSEQDWNERRHRARMDWQIRGMKKLTGKFDHWMKNPGNKEWVELMVNVIPNNDEREHIHGTDCWCEPLVEWQDPETSEMYADGPMIGHNSADHREFVEALIEESIEKGKNWTVYRE